MDWEAMLDDWEAMFEEREAMFDEREAICGCRAIINATSWPQLAKPDLAFGQPSWVGAECVLKF